MKKLILQMLGREKQSGSEPLKDTIDGYVQTRLHGFDAFLNEGNTYPDLVRRFPLFNAPLVELVHQVSQTRGRGITILDVGASLGDSVLLLREKCGAAVEKFICVEGDSEFYSLLQRNVAQFQNVQCVQSLVARERTRISSLVKHHAGTAGAFGDDLVDALPLDAICESITDVIDVLKIDVDGFDGEVLAGAGRLLATSCPAVIFEWHPKLVSVAKMNPYAAFDALDAAGYNRFLWFRNVGAFSHFSEVPTREVLTKMNDYLLRVNARADDHFDVIALPEGCPVNEIALSALASSHSDEPHFAVPSL
jgi:FkbM family methyltransferase